MLLTELTTSAKRNYNKLKMSERREWVIPEWSCIIYRLRECKRVYMHVCVCVRSTRRDRVDMADGRIYPKKLVEGPSVLKATRCSVHGKAPSAEKIYRSDHQETTTTTTTSLSYDRIDRSYEKSKSCGMQDDDVKTRKRFLAFILNKYV